MSGQCYQRGLSGAQALRRHVDGDEAATAAGVDSHARAVEVEGIRNPIRHDGDAVAGGGILGLPVGVSKAYLLVICDV